ncbi:hypothetical protein Vadar_019994 [Vaccinium darrowii]|uniref:Uncharacterized protein n=1 Tax=Vaccinium darrowii TaxID=229202 RepID=A0ACB7YEJ2_9ERIC|nr:hypothetical protein Vadar_019994 [Vaccinium darrowii]
MEGEISRKEEEAEAQVDVWKYVYEFVDTTVVKCAIELGIPDALETRDGPTILSDLSSSIGCSPSTLHHIMRFLLHHKIFKEGLIGYLQTPLSRLLMKNGEKSLPDFLLYANDPEMLAPWHSLSARVLANESPAFESAHGEDVWRYAAKNQAKRRLLGFNNFDLPHVVSVTPDCVGVVHVGGDMFVSVSKADVAYLKWVLHDWDDEECIEILRKCREAIPKDKGKVIIIEAVVEEDKNDKLEYVRLTLDMVMMAHTNRGLQMIELTF